MHSPSIQSHRNPAEIPSRAFRFRQASQVLAFLVAALGVVVLCGWVFDIAALTSIRPTFYSMKVNTALAFLCLGAALWLAHNDERQRSRRTLGFLVIIIAAATLAEYAFHASLGIDQLLFRDIRWPTLPAYPGRMSIVTAICFLFLGLAVAFLGLKKAIALQRALVVACLAFSLVALCGYLFGVESLYAVDAFPPMALHTAAGIFAACLAYFFARPDEGIVSIAASDSNSGFLLRTLIPATIVVPILIAWLRLEGQRANLYDTPFGIALQVLGSVACLLALTMLVVRSMYRMEREQARAEESLRKSEEKFFKAFRESPMIVTLTRAKDHVYLDVNESFERWTGWRRDEVIGRTPFDIGLLVNPTQRSELVRRLLAEGGVLRNLEVHYRPRDGEERVGLASAELIEIENEPCALSVITDITERKRTEDALKESESRFRLLADSAPALIWMSGTDKLCTYFNKPWLNFTGRPMEAELGNGWAEGVHGEDFQRCLDTYTQAFDRREEFRMEYRLRRHDGEYRWVLDIGIPRFDPSRSFLGYTGIAIDVTERKRANEALRESEQRLRLAQQTAGIGTFEWNIQSGVVIWTPELEAMYGLAPSEFGKTQLAWERLVHPEDRASAMGLVDRAFKTGEAVSGEWRAIRRDGSVRWILGCFQVFKTAEGESMSLIGVNIDITERKRAEAELEKHRQHLEELVRERTQQLEAANAQLQTDITERKRVEEALRQSESQFRSLFEGSSIAVFVATPDGGILAANPAACAMLRMSEAEIRRAGRNGLVDLSDPRFAAALEQRQRTGRVVAAELNFIRGNGERFPVELDSVILPGSASRVFVMVRDITERKQTEAALLRSEKLASLGRMAASIAHEINNPLAAVTNLLFLAKESKELAESTHRLLEMADAELRRVAHIAQQSLGFYHESNAPALTSVSTVLNSVLDLLKNKINEKHAIIEKQWKGDVQITAVAGELRQVFSNLVSNSLDAIDKGGTIKVRVSAGKDCIRVTLTDNGKGIPPGTVKHIFEPFFTTKDRVGTGLGLWVSQQIIEKNGGKIQVRSSSDGLRRGTTLSVVLPMQPTPAEGLLSVA